MISIKILAFGIAKDIINETEFELEVNEATSIRDLKQQFIQEYPAFDQLASLQLAVNGAYVSDDLTLQSKDEVAIIPPVSGG